jgi:hypothetical protein
MMMSEENMNDRNDNIVINKTGENTYDIVIGGKTVRLDIVNTRKVGTATSGTVRFVHGRRVYRYTGFVPENDDEVRRLVGREADMIRSTVLSGQSFDADAAIRRYLRF